MDYLSVRYIIDDKAKKTIKWLYENA
jgi:hypothetical protein